MFFLGGGGGGGGRGFGKVSEALASGGVSPHMCVAEEEQLVVAQWDSGQPRLLHAASAHLHPPPVRLHTHTHTHTHTNTSERLGFLPVHDEFPRIDTGIHSGALACIKKHQLYKLDFKFYMKKGQRSRPIFYFKSSCCSFYESVMYGNTPHPERLSYSSVVRYVFRQSPLSPNLRDETKQAHVILPRVFTQFILERGDLTPAPFAIDETSNKFKRNKPEMRWKCSQRCLGSVKLARNESSWLRYLWELFWAHWNLNSGDSKPYV